MRYDVYLDSGVAVDAPADDHDAIRAAARLALLALLESDSFDITYAATDADGSPALLAEG